MQRLLVGIEHTEDIRDNVSFRLWLKFFRLGDSNIVKFLLNLLIMKQGSEILPGWKIFYEELSNNVFNMSLRDGFGRTASTTEAGFENALKKVEKYAYEIEMSINDHPNKFLFSYFLTKLKGQIISKGESTAYGTWGIVTKGKQLVLEGRDDVIQTKEYLESNSSWECINSLAVRDLSFENFQELVAFMIK
jgi:hypothetical protein